MSVLVPSYQRSEWLAEWRSELAWAYNEANRKDVPRKWKALRLRAHALGALHDALWLRREHGGAGKMRDAWKEATRMLRRQPTFALMVVCTLALGIGATTAIFSVLDAFVLRPLPFRDPDQLVALHVTTPAGSSRYVSIEDARVWMEREDIFSDIQMHTIGGARVLTRPGEPRNLRVDLIQPGFLRMLGLAPALGREFAQDETVPGRDRVVMLSDETWRTAFASNPTIVGETIFLNDEPYMVVGVFPPELRVIPGGIPEIAFPLTDPPPERYGRSMMLLGRLRVDMPRAVAQARLDALSRRMEEEQPREAGWGVQLTPLGRRLDIATRRGLQALAGAVTFLLLVACINAAGLLFVRGVARRTEMSIRGALGSTRSRLFRESLAESILLASLAGIGGVLLAWWGVRVLAAIAPESLLRWSYNVVGMDTRVLVFTLLLTIATGFGFGILPAVRAARGAGFAGNQRSATAGRSETRLRSVVQALQVALAVVLLAGAGLLGRSFVQITAIDPGFDPDGLLVVSYALPSYRYTDATQRTTFNRELDARLQALPGVRGVSWNSFGVPPRIGFMAPVAPEVEGQQPIAVEAGMLPWAIVDSAYFDVMGTPIVQGRTFNASDLDAGVHSVIIDIDLANALWPNGGAVGQQFRAGPDRDWVTVVGVSGDVKIGGLDDGLGRFVFFEPTSIDRLSGPQIAIRTAGNAATLSSLIRETIHAMDPGLPVGTISAEQLLRDSIQERRFVLTTMTVFAIIALVLAVIGVYGLVAFTVARRTREIGIRKAIGARDAEIVGGVLQHGVAIGIAGLVIGLAAAALLSRTIASLLFDVPRHDPITLVATAAVLMLACTAALVVPARRAARVDAANALRIE